MSYLAYIVAFRLTRVLTYKAIYAYVYRGGGSRQLTFVGDVSPFSVHIFISRVQLQSSFRVTLLYLHHR